MIINIYNTTIHRELYKGWDIYEIGVGGNEKKTGHDQEMKDSNPDKNMWNIAARSKIQSCEANRFAIQS